MNSKTLGRAAILLVAIFSLSACGNTIRGAGADMANTVDATQAAATDVDSAATY